MKDKYIWLDEVTAVTKEAWDKALADYKKIQAKAKRDGKLLDPVIIHCVPGAFEKQVVTLFADKNNFKKLQENIYKTPTLAFNNDITMKSIDLRRIVADHNLDVDQLAVELFPSNKYPKVALKRVLTGDADLSAPQIAKLAALLNVGIEMLFTGGWKASSKKGTLVFSSDDYRAELDTEKWQSKVFVNDTLFHETVLHAKSITLIDYIELISKIVNLHKKK